MEQSNKIAFLMIQAQISPLECLKVKLPRYRHTGAPTHFQKQVGRGTWLDNTMIWVQAHRLQTDIYYSGKKQHDDIGPHFRTNRQDASSSFIFFCLDRPSLVWSWWLSNFLRKLSPGIAMLGHTFPGWILMIIKLFKKIVSWDCPMAFGSWTPCGRLGEEVFYLELSIIVNNR